MSKLNKVADGPHTTAVQQQVGTDLSLNKQHYNNVKKNMPEWTLLPSMVKLNGSQQVEIGLVRQPLLRKRERGGLVRETR